MANYEPCSICEEYIEGVICNKDKCPVGKMKAEVKRLTKENIILSQKRANIFEIVNSYERGRAEAIKEFAEKLKEYFPSIAKAIDHTAEELIS